MEHVEVLRDLSEVCRAAIKAGDWKIDGARDPDAALRRADAAIASLSAPQSGDWVLVPREATPEMWEAGMNCHSPDDTQGDYLEKAWDAMLDAAPQSPAEAHCATCSCVPGMTPAVRFDTTPAEKEGAVRDHLIRMGWTPPAEAQPVAWLSDWKHAANGGVTRDADIAAAWETRGEVTPLYAAPPSAPVGVDGAMVERAWEAAMEIKHNKEPWFPMTKRRMKRALGAALAQQPAAVDDLNAWRAAFIEERAARYRESGMSIEQARIHAETDAARIDALAAAAKGVGND